MFSSSYRVEIDGLRALAVAAVIAFHFDNDLLPGGFLGVDVFFVISGYVITSSLHRDPSRSLSGFISGFYARRIRRLLPGLIPVVIIGAICFWLFSSGIYAQLGIRTGVAALFGLSNLYLLRQAFDYWGGLADLNPFTHTWSLGVEEQFYFLFPPFLWYFGFRNSVDAKRITNAGVTVLAALAVMSAIGFVAVSRWSYSLVFYGTPFRVWELSIGALLYIFEHRGGPGPLNDVRRITASTGGFRNTAISLGLVAALCVAIVIKAPTPLANAAMTVMAAGVTGVLLHSIRNESSVKTFFSRPVIVYIGKLSYSLYLWHWIILVLSRWSIGITLWTAPFQLAAIVACSAISYEFVEKKLRYVSWSFKGVGTILVGSAAAFAAGIFLVTVPPLLNKLLDWRDPWAGVKMLHDSYPCHLPFWSKDPIADCLVPKKPSLKHIYLIGDSHATNLLPSILETVGSAYEVRYLGDVALTYSMVGAEHSDAAPCGSTGCEKDELGKRLAFFRQYLKSGDIVIFAFSRDIVFDRDYEATGHRTPVELPLSNLTNSLRLLARGVQASGGQLYVIDNIPKACSNRQYAIGAVRHPVNPCQGSRAASLADRAPVSAAYRTAVAGTNALIFDPHPYLCPAEVCQMNIAGRVLAWDGSPHFLNTFPDPLKGMFADIFSQLDRH